MTQNFTPDPRKEILARLDFLEEYRAMGVKFEGTTPNSEGWVPCHAYDRDDRNASAAVNLNNGYYIDSADTTKKTDFFGFAMRHYGFPSFRDMINHYKEKCGLATPSRKPAQDLLARTPHTISLPDFTSGKKPWELSEVVEGPVGEPPEDTPALHDSPEENASETRKSTPAEQIERIPWNSSCDWWCGLKSTNQNAIERAGGFLCRYKGRHICVGFPVFNPKNMRKENGFVVEAADGTSNIPLEQFDDKFALIQMRNKLVNIVDDLSDTGSICEGKLKSIVSGQTISSDRKNKSQVSFEPTARLIFACNTLPRLRDKSAGVFRRLTFLRFNKTIPESRKRPEFTTKKFWKKEALALFNWCLDGLLRLRFDQNRFYECPESRAIAEDLYEKYKSWAVKNGHFPISSENLGIEVKRKFHVEKKRSGGKPRKNYYPGIRLVDDDF